jgi:hypothetical protein
MLVVLDTRVKQCYKLSSWLIERRERVAFLGLETIFAPFILPTVRVISLFHTFCASIEASKSLASGISTPCTCGMLESERKLEME